MTVVLGWKHAVVAAILVALAMGAAWFAIRSIREHSVEDFKREQLIEGLAGKLDKAMIEVDRLHGEIEGYQKERASASEALATALRRLRKAQAIPEPTPEDREEICASCLAAVSLLEGDLRLADLELLTLRKQTVVLRIALEDSQDMFELQTKRLQAAQKARRVAKRRSIWSQAGWGASGLALGAGLGRIGCKG